jgi:hypothetical protein
MEHDIEYLELPVGQTIDFLVLHKMDGATVMGCEAYGKILAHVHTTMIEEMNNYCNSAPEKSYVPRYSELCLARFEGMFQGFYIGSLFSYCTIVIHSNFFLRLVIAVFLVSPFHSIQLPCHLSSPICSTCPYHHSILFSILCIMSSSEYTLFHFAPASRQSVEVGF